MDTREESEEVKFLLQQTLVSKGKPRRTLQIFLKLESFRFIRKSRVKDQSSRSNATGRNNSMSIMFGNSLFQITGTSGVMLAIVQLQNIDIVHINSVAQTPSQEKRTPLISSRNMLENGLSKQTT